MKLMPDDRMTRSRLIITAVFAVIAFLLILPMFLH